MNRDVRATFYLNTFYLNETNNRFVSREFIFYFVSSEFTDSSKKKEKTDCYNNFSCS